MRSICFALGLVLLACVTIVYAQQQQSGSQENPKETAAASPAAKSDAAPAGGAGVNPVKSTPEGLAAAKKLYGYDCAMCHGKDGDGKGDLASSMNLKLNDWRSGEGLKDVTDQEMFDIISKGKGKMTGEGDRMKPTDVWNMIHYVKSLSKKS